jgi:hypothetical protein
MDLENKSKIKSNKLTLAPLGVKTFFLLLFSVIIKMYIFFLFQIIQILEMFQDVPYVLVLYFPHQFFEDIKQLRYKPLLNLIKK